MPVRRRRQASPDALVETATFEIEPVDCFAEGNPCSGSDTADGGAGCSAAAHDLSGLDEDERLLRLAALTAMFSARYLRWMRSQAPDALPYSAVRVLEVLETSGPTIMRNVADALGVTARNMTAVIDTLEDAGLVRRMPHPHDRRATVVDLTDAGREAGAGGRRRAAARVAGAFGSLSAEEQDRYVALLHRLSGHFCQ